jgi:hypothetical protein
MPRSLWNDDFEKYQCFSELEARHFFQVLDRFVFVMHRARGNPLKLGMVDGKRSYLEMTPEMRSTHLYVCGSTGTGKSKMLEYLVRQDIKNWYDSQCGALIIDPHGTLYNSIINWIAWNEPLLKDVPIVPIDLRQRDWTISYNVMRPRTVADPAVVISNFVQAMAHVWGADGTQNTPLFARIGKEVLWPLYEKRMTLLEAEYLVSPSNKNIRCELTEGLSMNSVSQSWEYRNGLSPRDFDIQCSSTINRFYTFLQAEKLRLMFGQNGASLDLGKALEEGQIIIANVSTEGGRASEEDASLFATLLLSDLWTAAKERGKGTDECEVKPFYVYIDEFQSFVTPTIAKNLDQARGFGLHLTLVNQFPGQILHSGANGQQVYDSVMANARSKMIFSVEGEADLKSLAQSLFMGVLNPDEIKLALYSTKVMDYVEETRTIRSTGENWSEGEGLFTGQTDTEGIGGAIYDEENQDPRSWNQTGASSNGTSRTSMRGGSQNETTVPFLKPVFGKELSSVQYRSLDEQLFRAMATLFDQQQRHGVVRLVGTTKPVKMVTPIVEQKPTPKELVESFLSNVYEKLPFALKSVEAAKQIEERKQRIFSGLDKTTEEPKTAKRRISIKKQDGADATPSSGGDVQKVD